MQKLALKEPTSARTASLKTPSFISPQRTSLFGAAGCHSVHSHGTLAIHLTTCAEELVTCKYASIGCDEVIKRKDLQTHLRDKKDYHLERAMDAVVQGYQDGGEEREE